MPTIPGRRQDDVPGPAGIRSFETADDPLCHNEDCDDMVDDDDGDADCDDEGCEFDPACQP